MPTRGVSVWTISALSLVLLGTGEGTGLRDDRAAIVGGKPVALADLGASLYEAAGGLVLEEAVLDSALAERLARAGVVVTPEAIERERRAFTDALSEEAGATDEQAGVLLERVRRARGLGPNRFEALLRRNAGLRTLVGSIAAPERADLDRAVSLEFGVRCRARVLTVESPAEANGVRARLVAIETPGHLPAAFATEALSYSLDATRNAGGLMLNVSPDEPGVSGVVRSALKVLEPGKLSEVLGGERGYTLVLVESRTPGREPTSDERARVEAKLRQRMERVAMDRLARELLDAAKPIVLDPSLRWSWENPPR